MIPDLIKLGIPNKGVWLDGTHGAPHSPVFENFVFFNTETEKSTFRWMYNYSIYMSEGVTPLPTTGTQVSPYPNM